MSDSTGTTISGSLLADNRSFVIVASRFNSFITEKLVAGARDAVQRHGGVGSAVDVVWVPGAWEIPLAVKWLVRKKTYDAIICLGCVIRGDTAHFEHVAGECAKGIASAMLDSEVPITNGVLATENLEQAIDRAGGKAGNKGWEAACAAIEMANLMRELDA